MLLMEARVQVGLIKLSAGKHPYLQLLMTLQSDLFCRMRRLQLTPAPASSHWYFLFRGS